MRILQLISRALLAAALGVWSNRPAVAQGTFVMPSSAATTYGNPQPEPFMPGRAADYPVRYQEVFGASDMGMPFGVHYITAVSFRLAAFGQSSLDAVLPGIEIRMSTTPKEVNQLATKFANNIGPDETVVFPGGPLQISATYVPGGVVQPFDIRIDFATPFLYDRSWGNLLLDIVNYGGSDRRVGFDYFERIEDSVGSVGGDATNPDHGGAGTPGLVAQFEYRDVPEPRLLFLLAMGSVPWLVRLACRNRKCD